MEGQRCAREKRVEYQFRGTTPAPAAPDDNRATTVVAHHPRRGARGTDRSGENMI